MASPASIQFWTIICKPAKRDLNGILLVGPGFRNDATGPLCIELLNKLKTIKKTLSDLEPDKRFWTHTCLDIINIYHKCGGWIKKFASRITVWHHQACWGRDFYSTLTRIMNTFSCSPLSNYFKISFLKYLNMLRCNTTWWRHFDITMTSLDYNAREF